MGGTYQEQFVDKDTSFVDHGKIERSPVLEERQVEQLVIDGEVPILRVILGCRRG